MTAIAAPTIALPKAERLPQAAEAQEPRTGRPCVLATYNCDEGERKLVGQRVKGVVRITDRRRGGRSYLVEEGLASMAEIEALIADYLAKAAKLGYAPMQGWF